MAASPESQSTLIHAEVESQPKAEEILAVETLTFSASDCRRARALRHLVLDWEDKAEVVINAAEKPVSWDDSDQVDHSYRLFCNGTLVTTVHQKWFDLGASKFEVVFLFSSKQDLDYWKKFILNLLDRYLAEQNEEIAFSDLISPTPKAIKPGIKTRTSKPFFFTQAHLF